ncbi:DUF4148 domain-containing protein [Paraburkholderia acidisoli]|uniref:DUF4148 domain-containing protein n=1 Tax=Paraburkholderia acidisoli TaxID=2571748 RepID=A0A7Z2GMC3_9BURK|nr:DUF4148 domain-containing protein [Paraburkholderia acidisoli]QGZ64457.1 DUF4148 domain-containing protein [Paraburkholderia acidisoli]
MPGLVIAMTIAAAYMLPARAFAQTNAPVTRAQVKAELRALEQVGYNPAISEDINYPSDIQAAEARLRATGPVSTPVSSATNRANPVTSPSD